MNPATATRSGDPRVPEILRLENERRRALVEQDFAALAELFAEDVVYTHSTGAVQDKAAYLAYVQAGTFKFLSIDRGDLTIRFIGDVAISTGTMTNTIAVAGTPQTMSIETMVTQVFVKRDGAWRHVIFQATRTAEPVRS